MNFTTQFFISTNKSLKNHLLLQISEFKNLTVFWSSHGARLDSWNVTDSYFLTLFVADFFFGTFCILTSNRIKWDSILTLKKFDRLIFVLLVAFGRGCEGRNESSHSTWHFVVLLAHLYTHTHIYTTHFTHSHL